MRQAQQSGSTDLRESNPEASGLHVNTGLVTHPFRDSSLKEKYKQSHFLSSPVHCTVGFLSSVLHFLSCAA